MMKRLVCLALVAGCAPTPVAERAQPIIGGFAVSWSDPHLLSVNRAVIGLDGAANGYTNGMATGSGILVAPTLVLTNRHVGHDPCKFGNPVPQIVEIGPLAFDPLARIDQIEELDLPCGGPDLALWVLDQPPLDVLPYWKRKELPGDYIMPVALGDPVVFYGYGSDDGALRKAPCTVSGWMDDPSDFSSDCGLAHGEGGDSGGPMFDAEGYLVALHRGSGLSISGIDSVDVALKKPLVEWVEGVIDEYATELRIGDFDGDGRDDFFHWNKHGHRSWFDQANGLNDSAAFPDGNRECVPLTFCAQKLVIGKFDGDDRDDLLCYGGGALVLNYASVLGCFGAAQSHPDSFCGAGKLVAGDFDGDGLDDLVCAHDDGALQARFNSGDPSAPFLPILSANWCIGGEVMAGRFVDGRKDTLLCRLWGQGFSHRGVTRRGFGAETGWASSFCSTLGDQFLVGDFDADLLADLMCWNKPLNQFSIDYSSGSATPFTDINVQKTNFNWCDQIGIAAYMNAGHAVDLVCHDPRIGRFWIDLNSGGGDHFDGNAEASAPNLPQAWPLN